YDSVTFDDSRHSLHDALPVSTHANPSINAASGRAAAQGLGYLPYVGVSLDVGAVMYYGLEGKQDKAYYAGADAVVAGTLSRYKGIGVAAAILWTVGGGSEFIHKHGEAAGLAEACGQEVGLRTGT